MAGFAKNLTKNAGPKVLALFAALALWVLVPIEESREEPPQAAAAEVQVAVEPIWAGAESSDLVVEEFTVAPATVRVAGPAERLALLDRLTTEPIDVGGITADGVLDVAVILPDRQLRFVDNSRVRVEVKVTRR